MNGLLYKFVCTNCAEYVSKVSLVEKTHELNYHVVLAQQSHSEAAILQFLQERPNVYSKDPVAMGCHRETCK
jgi:hypothetical protein